jgi:hypothetical protein
MNNYDFVEDLMEVKLVFFDRINKEIVITTLPVE